MPRSISMQVEHEFALLYQRCQPYTMVDLQRCHTLYTATRYVIEHGIPGDLVECGVWRGGCSMLMAMVAAARQATRDLLLFDTFTGMTQPCEHDINAKGESAEAKWQANQKGEHNEWCFAPLDEVRRNMAGTGYDPQRIHYVRGPVEETLPHAAPEQIAVLRLDTDFYQSTYHELVHLYPRLAVGGVLILDDYHHWQGQQKALQQYFTEQGIGMMLTYASTSAVGVKTAPVGLSRQERKGAPVTISQAG
jgi:O-methyltransferase